MSSTPQGPDAPPPPPAEPGSGDRPRPFAAVSAGAGAVRRSLSERIGGSGGGDTATQSAFPSGPADAPRESSAASSALAGPRRVRLTLSRIDPWSAMKLSFLLSVAIAIGIVIAAALVWFVLDSMYVFADIEELFVSIGSEGLVELMGYLEFDRVMSLATIVAVIDVLLITALGTIGAFVYNLVAALVGGLHVTLTDD